MKWGKLVLVIGIALVIVCTGALIFLIAYREDTTNHARRVTDALAYGIENDCVIAKDGDVTTKLTPNNCEALAGILTITERKPVSIPDELDRSSEITVTIGQTSICFVQQDPNVDFVYMITDINGKSRSFTLTNYRAYVRVEQIVSAEGYYGPNEVVE